MQPAWAVSTAQGNKFKVIFKNKKYYDEACETFHNVVLFSHRYLALESMCLLATSEFSHDAVKKHQETIINALKVRFLLFNYYFIFIAACTSLTEFYNFRLKEM